jgi:hypothetical protein
MKHEQVTWEGPNYTKMNNKKFIQLAYTNLLCM